MEKVILQTAEEMLAKEKLPKVPAFVHQWVSKGKNGNCTSTEGSNFTIQIVGSSADSRTDGIAYSNEMQVLHKGNVVYRTGMLCYRGAYASDRDNDDNAMSHPIILKEDESEVQFAHRSGAGNIKLCRCTSDGTMTVVRVFNLDQYESATKRIAVVEQVVNDIKACTTYLKSLFQWPWRIDEHPIDVWVQSGCQLYFQDGTKLTGDDYNKIDQIDFAIFLATHWDREYDPIADQFQLYFWKKGVGLGKSKVKGTGLSHPRNEKFYVIGVGIDSEIESHEEGMTISVTVRNRKRGVSKIHSFQIESVQD